MVRLTAPRRFARTALVLLGWALAAWPAATWGQEWAPSPLPASPQPAPPSPGASQELLQRLGKLEARLDWLTRQNDGLLHENKLLAEKVGPLPGPASAGLTAPGDGGAGGPGSAAPGASPAGA